MTADLPRYVEFGVNTVRDAGAVILKHFRTVLVVDNKDFGGFDPVTIADKEAESYIRSCIASAFPAHGIVGEEHGTVRGEEPMHWLIDPIDGTRAFITGQLHWGTLLALNDGERPIFGVMHQPYVDETFVGSALGAYWLRGRESRRLTSRRCARLAEAVLCTTDPRMFPDRPAREAFERLAAQCRLVRYGGDCYTPCLLAAGQIDLVVESGLQPFDVQPLMPIVEAAGGAVSDWQGDRADRGGDIVFAGDRPLLQMALETLANP